MKIRAELSETENSKLTEKINETKIQLTEKTSKIDISLSRLTKIKKDDKLLISEMKEGLSLQILKN